MSRAVYSLVAVLALLGAHVVLRRMQRPWQPRRPRRFRLSRLWERRR